MSLQTTAPAPLPGPPQVEPRVRVLVHEGHRIVLIDASRLSIEEAKKVFVDARVAVAVQGERRALTLTDVTGLFFDDALVAVVRETVEVDKPYVKAAAVVGVTGLKKIVINTIIMVTRRPLKTFDTREQALAWLAAQA